MHRAVHDMRNDLAVAIATAYAVMDGKLPPDRENLGDVVRALEALDVKLRDESQRSRDAAGDARTGRHPVLDALPMPAMIVDGNRIAFANAFLEELLGYEPDELRGSAIDAFVPARYLEPPLQPRDDRDVVAVCKDGSERPVELRLRPLLGSHEGGVLGIVNDLDERKRAEVRLLALIEAAPNAMVLVGDGGDVMLVNAQTERLFGYARGEMLGKSIEMLIPEDVRSGHVALRDGYAHAPTARPMGVGRDLYGRRKDGAEIPIEIGLNPIVLPEGDFVLASVIDITERRRAEGLRLLNATMHEHNERLEALNRELENASRFKSQFVATMSHELRTPLTAIIGLVEFLRKSRLDGTQHETVDAISGSAEALLAIINSILDFSKIEAGKIELRERAFSARAVVEAAAKVLAQQAGEKGVAFETHVDPRVPHLRGDADRVRQILLNLMANAVKFTDRGRIGVRVLPIGAPSDHAMLRFEVRDTGIGIDAETIPRLFEPFVQADSSLSRPFTGTGLGLSISKRLVELMGGEIGVESVPGVGSLFWFTARFAVAAGEPETAPGDPPPASAAALRAPVLVAEDNVQLRKLLKLQFDELGVATSFVADGREAVDALRAGRYALVFMDCHMPNMDGLEATRVIRAHERATGAHVPIVAMTANAFVEDRELCLAAGMDDYLAKPVRAADLGAAIARWAHEPEVGRA